MKHTSVTPACPLPLLRTLLVGSLLLGTARADWTATSGGAYENTANWAAGDIDNTFLSSAYAGTAQSILISSDGSWNAVDPVITSHGNGVTLLLRATGSDRNLSLPGVNYTATTNNAANLLQFGTTVTNEKINFSLSGTTSVQVASPQTATTDVAVNTVAFNGVLSGTGGITKTGNGSLYLQNAAATFTGTLSVLAGRTTLLGAGASLATQDIVLGRADLPNSSRYAAFGVLTLGNDTTPLGTNSGSAGSNSNRISDTATVTMNGGALVLGSAATGTSVTETVGTVALNKGASHLLLARANGAQTNVATLAISNLTRAAGTALTVAVTNNAQAGLTLGTDGKVTLGAINGSAVSGSLVNGILPWAVRAAGSQGNSVYGDFLTYDDTNGLVALTTFATDINTSTSTSNVKVSSTANVTGNRSANSLTLSDGNLTTSSAANTLTLTSGAINQYTGYIGSASSVAVNLDFNGREAIIFSQRNLGIALSGNLSNTGGNGLTFNGIGYGLSGATPYLRLSGTNTYTGATTVNSGVLQVRGTASLPTASAVVINEGGGVELGKNNVAMASLSGVGYVEFAETGVAAGGGSSTLTIGSANTTTTFSGIIRNGGTGADFTGHLTKTGSGSLTLAGVNTYTGTTTVNAGVLNLGVANAIATSANVVLAGGTLRSAFSQTLAALNLSASSTLDLSTGGIFGFADSSALEGSWAGTLSIVGNFTDASSVRFGTNVNGLTAAQLAQISINGSTAGIDANGYLFAAIPEPSTYATILGAFVLTGVVCARRRSSR